MSGPNDKLTVSGAGLDLIAGFEGWRAELYEDVADNATIGYGHLVHAGPITAADRSGPFGKGITKQQGLDLLRKDVESKAQAVRQCVTVPLNQGQFDALVSFAYNVGAGNLRSSTLLKKLNAGDYAGAANEFGNWTKAGGKVLTGLQRRRAAEAAMFRGNAAPPPPPPAQRSWFSRTLQQGARGDDVKALQQRLHIGADGVFGPATKAAVVSFQRSKGLTADGVVGPRTAAALG
ncbi:MAG TPA: glycoside hydrolase family protein [Mycobacteriales bacterium]|jgi:lysozyme